jgi:hypothetical protein
MKFIPNAIANKFGRQLLHLEKASPQIMFAGGVVGLTTAAVLACRATLQLSDTLAKGEELKEKAEAMFAEGTNDDYDEKKYAKDLTVIKVRTILDITKLYGPAVGVGVISVCLLTGSHVTLNKRNASLSAAYAATDKAFTQYRDRVKEQLGSDADRDFRYGSEVVEEKVDGEDGKKKTVKHTRVAPGEPSQYARFFDELCGNWVKNPEYNAIFLRAQQNYMNDLLQARGHVFLNEVYDCLGIERSGAGAIVGWVIGAGGDDFIDFGIFDDDTNPRVRDFVNGRETSILLDFNVDGVIYDKI